MGINRKSERMFRDRRGIERSFICPKPSFDVTFFMLCSWLQIQTLSRVNIIWADEQVQKVREMWKDNLENQKDIFYLEELLQKAKERLKRREFKAAVQRKEIEIVKRPPKVKKKPGRPRKHPLPPVVIPVANPTAPPTKEELEDLENRWKRLMEEKS